MFGVVVGPSGVGWVYGLAYFGGIVLGIHLLAGLLWFRNCRAGCGFGFVDDCGFLWVVLRVVL